MISAAVSKYRSPPPNRRQAEKPNAAKVPMAMRVSMLASRSRALTAALRRKGQPAQNWIGRVRTAAVHRAQGAPMSTSSSTNTVIPSGQATSTRRSQARSSARSASGGRSEADATGVAW